MKSIKKLLMTGLTLSFVFFSLNQLLAMEQRVNPYLDVINKKWLEDHINYMENQLDPKSEYSQLISPEDKIILEKKISLCREAYYGNQPFNKRILLQKEHLIEANV